MLRLPCSRSSSMRIALDLPEQLRYDETRMNPEAKSKNLIRRPGAGKTKRKRKINTKPLKDVQNSSKQNGKTI